MKIPGIYVPIKGDFTALKKDINMARQLITEQSHQMSNDLNNALSPGQIQKSTKGLVDNLVTLNNNSKITSASFKAMGVDLGELRKHTGLTSVEFDRLQQKLLQSHAASAQEGAFRRIAKAANLTRDGIAALGKQFNLTEAQIERVTTKLHGAETRLRSLSQISQANIASSATRTVSSFANDLTALSSGGKIAEQAINSLDVELVELRKHVKMTDDEFDMLRRKLTTTTGEKVKANALRNLARQANLTEKEIRDLGRQFGMTGGQIDGVIGNSNKAAKSIDKVGKSSESTAQKMKTMIATVAIYSGAFAAVAGTIHAIVEEFKLGFSSIEEFNQTVAASAAYITTFSERANSGDYAGAYREASYYAETLAEKLEMIDAKTIAAGKDLQQMSETFIKHGVLLDINNQKQVDGFTSIATALALVTKGQNKEIQIRQEINALMNGQVRATDQLARLLKAKDPLLKEHLKTWREEGTVIENVGKLLQGFSAETGDLDDLWMTVGSTMETINKRVLRGGFEPAFNDLIGLAKDLNNTLMDGQGNLTPLAEGIQEGIRTTYEVGRKLVKDYGSEVSTLAGYLIAAKTAQLALNVAIKANPYFVAGSALIFLNEQLKAYEMNIGSLGGKWDEYTKYFNLGMEQLNGTRDMHTGRLFTEQEKILNQIADLKKQLSGEKSWWEFSLFEDPKEEKRRIEEIRAQIAALKKEYASIGESFDRALKNERPDRLSVPEMVKPPGADDDNGITPADWNATHRKEVDYLKALEEKKTAIVMAAAKIELQASENAYQLGLSSYQDYLDKKHFVTEQALAADLAAKRKALADAQGLAEKLAPVVDSQGNPRPDKTAKARFEALKRVEGAEKAVIAAQNKLTMAQVDGAHETTVANIELAESYKAIQIRLLEMQGLELEAALSSAQLEEDSLQRQQLIAEARAGNVEAQRALFAEREMANLAIKNAELDELARSKEAALAIADLTGEYQKAYDIQIELLKIEKQRAKLAGASPEELQVYDIEIERTENAKDPMGAFGQEWEDIANRWGNTTERMQDIAYESAQAMQDTFSDLFFDFMRGELDDLGDYLTAFAQSVQQAIADALAKKAAAFMMDAVGFHGGGVVGSDTPTFTRTMSAQVSTLPQYHTGLGADEYLAVLQDQETVFTEGQMDRLGAAISASQKGAFSAGQVAALSGKNNDQAGGDQYHMSLSYKGGNEQKADDFKDYIMRCCDEWARRAA